MVAPDNEKPKTIVALDDIINPASAAQEAQLIVVPSTLN